MKRPNWTGAAVLMTAVFAGMAGGAIAVGASQGADPAPSSTTLHQVADEATATPTPSPSAAPDEDTADSNSEPADSNSQPPVPKSEPAAAAPAPATADSESPSQAADRAEDAADRADDAADRAEQNAPKSSAPKPTPTTAPAEPTADPEPAAQCRPKEEKSQLVHATDEYSGQTVQVGAIRYGCSAGEWVETGRTVTWNCAAGATRTKSFDSNKDAVFTCQQGRWMRTGFQPKSEPTPPPSGAEPEVAPVGD